MVKVVCSYLNKTLNKFGSVSLHVRHTGAKATYWLFISYKYDYNASLLTLLMGASLYVPLLSGSLIVRTLAEWKPNKNSHWVVLFLLVYTSLNDPSAYQVIDTIVITVSE